MPVHSHGRTIFQVALDQSVAGSTDLVAAPGAGARIYVTQIVVTLSAAGTIKFTEGTGPTDITGAMNLGAAGGFVVGNPLGAAVLWTPTANSKLSIVSTVGSADGWIHYYLDT